MTSKQHPVFIPSQLAQRWKISRENDVWMRLRRDIYILWNVSPRPPRALIQKPLFCDISPSSFPSTSTCHVCRDQSLLPGPRLLLFACFLEKIAGYDLPGWRRHAGIVCVSGAVMNSLKKKKGEKKEAINDRGGFSAYNPPPPTVWHLLRRRKTNKARPWNRMTGFAVGHSFISLIVAPFPLFFFMFLSSCNQMRRCCLG